MRGVILVCLALLTAGCADSPPRSVVLMVVDTLRADHLGIYGYERETSPELDRLSRSAAVYDHAYAPSPWTLPSFGSIFTGRLPAEHLAGWPASALPGAQVEGRSFLPLRPGTPTLAETLEGAGLETAAVMNNAFLHPDFGVARGFRTYDHLGGNRKRIRRADQVVDRALKWLDVEGRGDFFLAVHFFDPHLNYDAPEGFRGRYTREISDGERHAMMDLRRLRQRVRRGEDVDWDFLIGAYDEEIAFVDQEIGRFWRELESRGLLDHSLVIVTADHGEEFGDHGGFEHGHSLFEELVRVPLLMWGPGVRPGRYFHPVSLVDIFPTVLDRLAIEGPAGLPGRPLGSSAPEIESRTLIFERTLYGPKREGALAWPYKVIREVKRESNQLFDLSQDPGETQDIARLRRAVAESLLEQLATYRAHVDALATDEAVQPDEKTLENLRSLGYIQ